MRKMFIGRLLVSCVLAATLAACGGGNDEYAANPPAAQTNLSASEQQALNSRLSQLGLDGEQLSAAKSAALGSGQRPANVPVQRWNSIRNIFCFFIPSLPFCKQNYPTPTPTPTRVPTPTPSPTATPTPVNNYRVLVDVQGVDGVPLKGAQVRVAGETATSNDEGAAQLASAVGDQVVQASLNGFINQSVRVKITTDGKARAQIIMRKAGETLRLNNAQHAQLIKINDMNAQVLLPENALVIEGTSTLASGAFTAQITPVDIRTNQLLAMPGNGVARDAQGQMTELISAGMMTVDFFDAAGKKLQLASGKKATIQMDLPLNSINGQAMTVGTPIPMWHFDEAKGMWVEEGVGQVINGYRGLAVTATVGHFSTWNWDFKFENPGSVQIGCYDSNNALTACNVTAKVTLPDGSKFTKSNHLPAELTTIYRMPSEGSIQWEGTNDAGMVASASSGTTGTVELLFAVPLSDHFVRCQLPSGIFTACTVDLSAQDSSGTTVTRSLNIPEAGGRVRTAIAASSYQLNAISVAIHDGSVYRKYAGNITTTSANGNIVIVLNGAQTVLNAVRDLSITCPATGKNYNDEDVTVRQCDRIEGTIYDQSENRIFTFGLNNVQGGSTVHIFVPVFPVQMNRFSTYTAEGVSVDGRWWDRTGQSSNSFDFTSDQPYSVSFNFDKSRYCPFTGCT